MKASSYSEYIKSPMALPIDKMDTIHEMMLSEIADDTDAQELYEMLLDACVKYAEIRQNWQMWSREEKIENDKTRTAYHDGVILQFNVLARYLRQIGHTATWRDELGNPEEDRIYRKSIGDMACYIAFVEGLCAR